MSFFENCADFHIFNEETGQQLKIIPREVRGVTVFEVRYVASLSDSVRERDTDRCLTLREAEQAMAARVAAENPAQRHFINGKSKTYVVVENFFRMIFGSDGRLLRSIDSAEEMMFQVVPHFFGTPEEDDVEHISEKLKFAFLGTPASQQAVNTSEEVELPLDTLSEIMTVVSALQLALLRYNRGDQS